MAPKNLPRRRLAVPLLPRLRKILAAFSDVRSLLRVVTSGLERRSDATDESAAYRVGLNMLDRVYDDLDRTVIDRSRKGGSDDQA